MDSTWKVGDFGLTTEGTTSLQTTELARGTSSYRAPELVNQQKAMYSRKSDIWSIGCILFELSVGEKAFCNDSALAFHIHTRSGLNVPLEGFHSGDASFIRANINKMLQIEPALRPSASSLVLEFNSYSQRTRGRLWEDIPVREGLERTRTLKSNPGQDTCILGIDFGNSYCRVAVWQFKEAQVILNNQGNPMTPTCLSFDPLGFLVGDLAEIQIRMNPFQITVPAAKRFIGHRVTDSAIQAYLKKPWCPFQIKDGKPVALVEHQNVVKGLTPEEITSVVLTTVRESAEAYLERTVNKAVFTCSGCVSNYQRAAIEEVGRKAGFSIVRIVSGTVATAVTLVELRHAEKTVLILDLGSSTCDVSLVTLGGDYGVIEVLATACDYHLGGDDFNNRLLQSCIQEFKRKHRKDISVSPEVVLRLLVACERAKCALSDVVQTTIEVNCLLDGIDFSVNITRARFEELCDDLFRAVMVPIEQVLRDAKLAKERVEEIVLVGGSTSIPRIRKLIENIFGNKFLRFAAADSAVKGAATVGALLFNAPTELPEFTLVDVLGMSVGIEAAGGVMERLCRRNASIPTIMSGLFSTDSDDQSSVSISIYEGEGARTKDNGFLGTLELKDIAQAPQGTPIIEITAHIDENRNIEIWARDTVSKKSNYILLGEAYRELLKAEHRDRHTYGSLIRYRRGVPRGETQQDSNLDLNRRDLGD